MIKKMLSFTLTWLTIVLVSFLTLPFSILLGNWSFIILCGILPSMAMCLLFYQTAYDEGFSDVNRLKINNIKYSPLKGFLFPILPFLLTIILYISYLFTDNKLFWLLSYYSGFYFSGFTLVFPRVYPILYLLFVIFAISVSGVAYILGYKRIGVSMSFIYQKPKK